MSTWQGVSHARMTRSMSSLSGGSYKVLAVVRRIIPDGARRKISQAEIAKRARVSEGTVSAALRSMDGIYLVRHFVGRGRGNGYEIEVLPPHEQRPVEAPSAPPKGSNFDPCNRSFADGVPVAQIGPPEGSESDPSIFSLHAHEQQQQTASLSEAATPAEQPAQIAPETIAALAEAGAHPKLIQRVATHNPTCTADEVRAAVAAAAAKPSAHTPPGLALECLALRQQIILPRQRAERPRRASAPSAEPPVDWSALQGSTSAIDDAIAPPDPVALLEQAIQLLGADPPDDDRAFLAAQLAGGAAPPAAIQALWQRRAAVLAQERASQDAQIDAVARQIGGRLTAPERDIVRRRLADGEDPVVIATAIQARRARPRGGR